MVCDYTVGDYAIPIRIGVSATGRGLNQITENIDGKTVIGTMKRSGDPF